MFSFNRKSHGICVPTRCAPCTAKTKWGTASTAPTSLRMVFWRWVSPVHIVDNTPSAGGPRIRTEQPGCLQTSHDLAPWAGATSDHAGFEGNKNGRGIWNKSIVFAERGSEPSDVIVQENSWSVAWTNAPLLNISWWLTELPFSQDILTKQELVPSLQWNQTVRCENVPSLLQVQYFFKILDTWHVFVLDTQRRKVFFSFFCLLFQPYAD